MFGYALTFDIKHITTAVYDHDQSPASRRLIARFSASGYFDIKATPESDDFSQRLDRGEIKVALIIPSGFGNDLAAGQKVKIQVLVDGSDPTVATVAFGYSAAIVSNYSSLVTAQSLFKKGVVIKEGMPPIKGQVRIWYNPELRSTNFIVPGLLALILMTITTIDTSLAIVREKERGTLENLIVSPIHSWELIIGKIAPYLGIAFLVAILITSVGVVWFGVPIRGSLSLLALCLTVYVAGTLGLGLLISSLTESQRVANLGAFMITMLPGFLLSGFVFPIRSMPFVLQLLTYLVPARYFLVILRGIFLKGIGLGILWPQLLALVIFAVAMLVLASLGLRRSLS
jgi:ABC-2 type transport system permease protein